MVGTTYGYHYGGPVRRGDRYRNVTSRSGLQMRHSSNTKQASSVQFKTEYDKLDATTKSALDKFTNKPDSQLTSAERDSLYRIEPWFYLQYVRNNHPNKVEFHKDRLKSFTGFKRNMEDNGLVPKESSETKPETQYAEQAAQDMVDNSKEEKSSKNKSIDDVWADVINEEWHKKYDVNWSDPKAVQNAKEDAFRTNDYTSYRYLSDEQIRQLYPDPKEAEALINGKYESAKHKSNPDYDDKYLQYSLMDDVSTYPNYGFPVPVGEIVPPVRAKINKKETVQELPVQEPSREPLKNNVTTWERPPMPSELPKKLKSNNPFLLIDPAEFKKTFGEGSADLNTPYGWSPYSYVRGRGINYNAAQPLSTAQKVVAGLGLGALGIYGLGSLVNDSQQTQVPYRMGPEPVNEAVAQPEPTLEQQYAAQDIPSFSTRIDNLFDLYQQQEQLMREKELAASQAYQNALDMGQRIATGTGYVPELKEGNFVFPQNPPEVGSNIKTTDLKSPNDEEVPKELDRLSGVKPKVIKDTPNGSVVLNDPNHRKTRDVQNNSVTPEQAAAKEMVNQYAGIPIEVARAKNSGYTPPFLTTDAIWDRVRKAGLSSPEQAIRSGLFTPTEVRYITENDLWRYR